MKKILLSLTFLVIITGAFAQDNRAWWESLSPAWKKIFLQNQYKGKEVDPTDEQLDAMISGIIFLDCSGNREITDLKPLARLRALQKLDCSNTEIKSLEGIEGLSNLKDLNCSNNDNINSLIPVTNLRNLESLNCGNTMVKSLAPIANLMNLRKLDVHFCTINQIAQLMDLKKLISLNVSQNATLYSLNGIEKMADLVSLDCSETSISDLTPLQNMKYLEYLNVASTKIATLRPIQLVRTIKDVDFSDTRISAASLDYFYSHYAVAMMRGRNLEVTQKQIDDFTASFQRKFPSCTIVITPKEETTGRLNH